MGQPAQQEAYPAIAADTFGPTPPACLQHLFLCAGGQQTVMEGLTALAQLVAEGGGRISVLPGGGVTEENAATVARVSGARRSVAQPNCVAGGGVGSVPQQGWVHALRPTSGAA